MPRGDNKNTFFPDKEDLYLKEKAKLNQLLNHFTNRMRDKVILKLDEGHAGWSLEGLRDYMTEQLFIHADKCDYLDVANIAMFLDNLELQKLGKGIK